MDKTFLIKWVKDLDDKALNKIKQVRQNELYNLKPNNNDYVTCITILGAIQKEQRRRKLKKLYE